MTLTASNSHWKLFLEAERNEPFCLTFTKLSGSLSVSLVMSAHSVGLKAFIWRILHIPARPSAAQPLL